MPAVDFYVTLVVEKGLDESGECAELGGALEVVKVSILKFLPPFFTNDGDEL